jgi:hypothetical protein
MATATAAAALGIPTGSLRNIESVRGRPVSLRVIHRAARLYSRSVDWLQGKDDKPEEIPKEEPARRDPTPSEPTAPPSRPDRDRKGPPRTELAAAS